MSALTHPDVAEPTETHRIAAASVTALPATAALSVTLWTVAGMCSTTAQMVPATALIFAALLPFSMTSQHNPGSAVSARMHMGRLGVVGAGLAVLVGLSAFGTACGAASTVVQISAAGLAASWAVWYGLRFTNSPAAHS